MIVFVLFVLFIVSVMFVGFVGWMFGRGYLRFIWRQNPNGE